MKVAIIGPICKDVNTIGKERTKQAGGVTYYTGQALASLGVETTVFGSFNPQDPPNTEGFRFNLVPIEAQGTITFRNIYDSHNYDKRTQEAETPNNRITVSDIPHNKLSGLDYLIFGPLYHDNISASTIEEFAKEFEGSGTKLVLAPQGMIRYLERDGIVWRNPGNVLEALPYVDYVFLDGMELKFISEEDEIEDGVHCFQEIGADNVIITKASQGSQLFLGDKHYQIRAFTPRELVDPTGTGDSYMAGFLKAQELFEDPLEQGEFAAMTATMVIERKGAFSGTMKEVRRKIEEQLKYYSRVASKNYYSPDTLSIH